MASSIDQVGILVGLSTRLDPGKGLVHKNRFSFVHLPIWLIPLEQITARSGDSVDTLTYKILNKDIPFTINAKTGDVCTAKVLDRESRENYEFAVSAEDGKFDAKVRPPQAFHVHL